MLKIENKKMKFDRRFFPFRMNRSDQIFDSIGCTTIVTEFSIKVSVKIYVKDVAQHILEHLSSCSNAKTRQCPCGTHLFPYEIFGTKIST